MKLLPLLFSAALARVSWGADTKVVFLDDSQTPSPENPPANWATWDAEEFTDANAASGRNSQICSQAANNFLPALFASLRFNRPSESGQIKPNQTKSNQFFPLL